MIRFSSVVLIMWIRLSSVVMSRFSSIVMIRFSSVVLSSYD